MQKSSNKKTNSKNPIGKKCQADSSSFFISNCHLCTYIIHDFLSMCVTLAYRSPTNEFLENSIKIPGESPKVLLDGKLIQKLIRKKWICIYHKFTIIYLLKNSPCYLSKMMTYIFSQPFSELCFSGEQVWLFSKRGVSLVG